MTTKPAGPITPESVSYLTDEETKKTDAKQEEIRPFLQQGGCCKLKMPKNESERRVLAVVCNRYALAGWDVRLIKHTNQYNEEVTHTVVIQHPMLRMPPPRASSLSHLLSSMSKPEESESPKPEESE